MNCTRFKCLIQSIGFSKQIRLFKLTGNLDLNNLNYLINGLTNGNFSQLRLKNDLKVIVPDSLVDLYQELEDSFEEPSILTALHSVYFTIKQIPGEEKVAFWIILTSILTGLFLLFILIVSLIKVSIIGPIILQ